MEQRVAKKQRELRRLETLDGILDELLATREQLERWPAAVRTKPGNGFGAFDREDLEDYAAELRRRFQQLRTEPLEVDQSEKAERLRRSIQVKLLEV